jgi:hypothetical protein
MRYPEVTKRQHCASGKDICASVQYGWIAVNGRKGGIWLYSLVDHALIKHWTSYTVHALCAVPTANTILLASVATGIDEIRVDDCSLVRRVPVQAFVNDAMPEDETCSIACDANVIAVAYNTSVAKICILRWSDGMPISRFHTSDVSQLRLMPEPKDTIWVVQAYKESLVNFAGECVEPSTRGDMPVACHYRWSPWTIFDTSIVIHRGEGWDWAYSIDTTGVKSIAGRKLEPYQPCHLPYAYTSGRTVVLGDKDVYLRKRESMIRVSCVALRVLWMLSCTTRTEAQQKADPLETW